MFITSKLYHINVTPTTYLLLKIIQSIYLYKKKKNMNDLVILKIYKLETLDSDKFSLAGLSWLFFQLKISKQLFLSIIN